MLRLSKNKSKKEINGTKFRITKWSVITTNLEGLKLAKVIAPSFTMVADMWMGKTAEQRELEAVHQEVGDIQFLLTGAMTQLCGALEDEHFMDLQDKLMSDLEYLDDGEWIKIDDWVEYFDKEENQPNMLDVMQWSIKENIWDFFMKQATFASKIEMVLKVLNPIKNQVKNLTESKESDTSSTTPSETTTT
ncbi:conserved hypothetical protein [Vibrio phage 424E50-1]|nr:conserved hypothetical protein [Vibrio phage 424E50-1]